MDLQTYKAQLAADPKSVNSGTWYARGAIHHNGEVFKAGDQLAELTNQQVLDLLEVNALTSVEPKKDETFPSVVHNGAPNQNGVNDDGVAHGNNQAAVTGVTLPDSNEAGGSDELPVGAVGRDEQGNPIDENGNPVSTEV